MYPKQRNRELMDARSSSLSPVRGHNLFLPSVRFSMAAIRESPVFTAPGNPYPCVCDTTGLFSERGQASENTGGLSPLHPIMSFAAYAGLVLFSTDPYVLACSKTFCGPESIRSYRSRGRWPDIRAWKNPPAWECVWTDCRSGSALSPHVWFLIVDVIALKIYLLWKTTISLFCGLRLRML